MADERGHDIKEWLSEVAATEPFERLRERRRINPNMPIPNDLTFAALVPPIINEDNNRISFNEVLANQIDDLLAEDERSKGGGSYKKGRLRAFARITHLTQDEGLSLEAAYEKTLDELQDEGIEDDRINLDRAYQRHTAKTLTNQIGQAISDNDQGRAVKLLEELRRRYNTFGRSWPA